jgi:hypothetical protein
MFSILYKDAAGNRITPFWGAEVVRRMEWTTAGGCATAGITAGVSKEMAGQMLGMCGTRLWIYNAKAQARWWGYIAGVRITLGGTTFETRIDELANRVAVKYTYQEAGDTGPGEARTTSWAEDAASLAIFGTKEVLVNANVILTDTGAEQLRDIELGWRKYLRAKLNLGDGGKYESVAVELMCRGFFDMLNWRYASWPVVTGPGYTDVTAAEQEIGAASSSTKAAQQFTVGSGGINVLQLSIYARKQGSPADNLMVGIYEMDGSGDPTGSALASWSLAGGSVGSSLAWITQDVTEVEFPREGTYTLQVQRSGAVDASNYYAVGVNTALGYTGGAFKKLNGSTWEARSPDADMNFQLYVNDKVESSAQIRDLVANFGPSLITARLIENSSGLYLRSYRDGSTTALDEIEELLESGTINGRRLMCEVTEGLVFVLREEPAESATTRYYIDADGRQRANGFAELPADGPVVGVYARLLNVLPGASSSVRLSDPTLQFIEGAVWEDGKVTFRFR